MRKQFTVFGLSEQERDTLLDKLIRRTKKTDGGCVEWQRGKDRNGYGKLHAPRTNGSQLAHRMSYELMVGEIPDGWYVCHSCDNPSCVNPAHLFTGTAKDNASDMVSKGRGNPVRGELAGRSELVPDQVREIRTKYAEGVTRAALAREYGVLWGSIKDLVNRKTWKHIA